MRQRVEASNFAQPSTGDSTADLRDQLERTLSGSYVIDREIGGGGMSRVFAATDVSLDRSVVVKVLEPSLAAAVNLERFRREIQVAARLQHAYIVPLLSAGATGDLPFYTMPLVEGESLRAILERRGQLPIPEVLKILRELAEALTYAHEHGIIHRDIKPENILVTPYHALITDFGVAKALSQAANPGDALTSVGMAIGTPAYMSPEQAVGDPSTDYRADIYAFGAVAYEMLTGQPVFSNRSPQAMLAAHAMEKAEPLDRRRESSPRQLTSLVMRCIEKNPADRPQSARDISAALDSITVGEAARPDHSDVRQRTSSRRSWLFAASAAVIVLAGVAGWWQSQLRDPATGDTKLVVLPFENLGNPDDQYFADGLSEEVTNRLVKLSGLSVVARSSAAKYKNSGKTAQQIGQELNVDYVLDGTVRWARSAGGGNLVRITPQLMNVSTGTQVWGEPYEAVLSEVFKLQTQIAENVAQALGGRLVQAEKRALALASTTNVEANDAYMLGRFHWKQRTAQSLQRAAQFFQQAIDRDPKFARAHAGLADSYSLYPFYDVTAISAPEAYRRAKAAASRAIQLDSTLAEAHASFGEVLYYSEWDFAGAHKALKKSVSLDPGYATAHQWLGEVLFTIGHLDESVAELKTARSLEPLSAVTATSLGFALWCSGDIQAAEREFQNAVAIDPSLTVSRIMAAMFYWKEGKRDRALEQFVAAGAPRDHISELLRGNDSEQASATALRAVQTSRGKSPEVYALLNQKDSAFAMLEREIRERQTFAVIGLKAHPVFQPLRSDPRFERILQLAGLTDAQLSAAGIPPRK